MQFEVIQPKRLPPTHFLQCVGVQPNPELPAETKDPHKGEMPSIEALDSVELLWTSLPLGMPLAHPLPILFHPGMPPSIMSHLSFP